MAVVAGSSLLEREDHIARLDGALAGLGDRGCLALLVGPAGIGKTELLREAIRRAGEHGVDVVSATAVMTERGLAFGVVRQLFELRVRSSGDRTDLFAGAARPAALVVDPGCAGQTPAADEATMCHALHWLCANLAERRPLLVAVDDAQWADRSSLAWLAYLARRVTHLPVALMATLRRPDPGAEDPAIQEMLALEAGIVVELPALSDDAVEAVVAGAYGAGVDESFWRACGEATGGNPFYLKQLLGSLVADQTPPTASGARRAREMGPGAVRRSVLMRIGALGEPAAALARSVAVFGADVPLGRAARLARLGIDEAAAAFDALAGAGVLAEDRTLRFAHPILRNAVYEDLSAGQRALGHAGAARLLADEHEPPERVAVHLLASEPAGDEWTVGVLAEAARRASAAGAVSDAATYLHRALAEPPPPHRRAALLAACGRAESAGGDGATASQLLLAAHEVTPDPAARAELVLELSRVLHNRAVQGTELDADQLVSETAELHRLFTGSLVELGEDHGDLALVLEAERAFFGIQVPALHPQLSETLRRFEADPPAGDTPGERRLLAALALDLFYRGTPLAPAVELAVRALGDRRLLEEERRDLAIWSSLIDIVMISGDVARAESECASAVAAAREWGSATSYFTAMGTAALVSWVAGDLREAISRCGATMDIWLEKFAFAGHVVLLAQYQADAGDLEGAEALFRRLHPDERQPLELTATYVRGHLHLAQGRFQEAAADLFAVGERLRALGAWDGTAMIPWRSRAGLALVRLSRRDEGLALIAEELETARARGYVRTLGIALGAHGLAEGGESGVASLREAVATLEATPFRLDHGRALVELGAALRRANRRGEAREALIRGLDLAHRCGAMGLAEQARAELATLGVRPRRARLTGIESLTGSERRVTELAAEGLTNKEIAQALFVTVKTVEGHLSHAFQKLGVQRRRDLAQALA